MLEGPPLPGEAEVAPRMVPPATPPDAVRVTDLDDPRSVQILAMEHTSLLATRSMLWNEAFARTALFLSVLSASVVALSLIGTERPDFRVFSLILLPVTLFIGVATFLRVDDSNREETLWVVGMNQIRHAYVTMVPGLLDRFAAGVTDDMTGIARSYGLPPDVKYSITHFFVTIPGMIAVVDGVIAGAIVASALSPLGLATLWLGAAAFVIGVFTTVLLGLRSERAMASRIARSQPRFPDLPRS